MVLVSADLAISKPKTMSDIPTRLRELVHPLGSCAMIEPFNHPDKCTDWQGQVAQTPQSHSFARAKCHKCLSFCALWHHHLRCMYTRHFLVREPWWLHKHSETVVLFVSLCVTENLIPKEILHMKFIPRTCYCWCDVGTQLPQNSSCQLLHCRMLRYAQWLGH